MRIDSNFAVAINYLYFHDDIIFVTGGNGSVIFYKNLDERNWSSLNDKLPFELTSRKHGIINFSNKLFVSSVYGLFSSEDNGNTWANVYPVWSDDMYVIGDELFVGTDPYLKSEKIGIVKSKDGIYWDTLSTDLKGLSANQFLANGDKMLILAKDSGFYFSDNRAKNWKMLSRDFA